MKTISIPISLLSLSSSSAFVSIGGRRLLAKPAYAQTHTTRFAHADAVENQQEDEVQRLRSMAAQLRAEASAMAAEQAKKLSEATERAFQTFDLDANGTIDKAELKIGLEKALKVDIPNHRVEQIMSKFDSNGDGVLQLEEFVTVDQFSNQLDALIREEKAVALEQSKQAEREEEERRLLEMKMAILNDAEPTAKDKIVSVAPYLFPLLDSLQFANLFVTRNPDNILAQVAAVIYTLYRQIPFGGFLTFFLLSFLSSNPSLNKQIRFNMQQAIYLDIALFIPGLFTALAGAVASGLHMQLPLELVEMGNNAIVLTMLATLAYASTSSLFGQTPDKIPFVSEATKKRMLTPEMFNDEGRFQPYRESQDEDETKK